MEEIWKPIPGFEGYYEASSLGRVRSVDRVIWNGKGHFVKNGTILKPSKNTSRSTPYFYVKLNMAPKVTCISLSVLICTTFNGAKPKDIGGDTDVECMHLNGNSLDNRAENLSWGTHTENMNEAKCLERHILSSPKKRCVVQYDLDGNEIARFVSVRDAARKTGLLDDHIAKCAAGVKHYHTHGGYKWKYEDEQEKKNRN